MRSWLVALAVFVAGSPSLALAQDVELRFDPALEALSEPVARGLGARIAGEVRIGLPLGAALAQGLPERAPDLGARVVGLVPIGDRVVLFATAPSGARHVSQVGLPEDAGARVRVVVVALEALLDGVAAPRAVPLRADDERVEDPDLRPIDGAALGDLDGPTPLSFEPSFVLELRGRASYATQRDRGFATTGIGAGACFGTWWCVVIDADVQVPEEDRPLEVGSLSYVATTLGLGGRFLPVAVGPLRAGVGIDATLRAGHLWTDTAFGSDAVSAGMRVQGEVGLVLGGPCSLVLELGADFAFNAVLFRQRGAAVFAEDVATLWTGLALRVGPT